MGAQLGLEHIESEIAIKPERSVAAFVKDDGAYRIGDCDQAGTPFARWPNR